MSRAFSLRFVAGLLAAAAALFLAAFVSGLSAQAGAAVTAEGSDLYALEFGEPEGDPEHAEPEDQQVLEDPAGWPWWAWVLVLLGLVAIGVPLALFLMRRMERLRSGTDRER